MIRRFFYLRLLRLSLVAGALYDLVFAGLMTAVPDRAAAWFRLPLPEPRFYLDLIAVFLAMLAVLYLVAAREPRRYTAVILVAIGGRWLGAIVFAVPAWGHPELSTLWGLAAADLVFGAVHLATWLPLRR